MRKIIFIAVCFLLSVFFMSNVFAKSRELKIKKSNFYYKLPAVKSSTSANIFGGVDLRKWGVLETVYDNSIEWADNVNFKYYVLLDNGEARGRKKQEKVVFAGEVTYMNVPEGKGFVSYMYIHPYAIKRYGKIEKFLVEIWHDGVRVSSDEWPMKSKKEWWLSIKGIVGNLYNKMDTPFAEEITKEGQIKVKVVN